MTGVVVWAVFVAVVVVLGLLVGWWLSAVFAAVALGVALLLGVCVMADRGDRARGHK